MKLNELFDDEFQQNLNPDLSKDDINGQYKNLDVDVNFNNPISNFLKRLRYSIPVLDMCISNGGDENHFIIEKNEILTFIIRNKTFHVSISIYFREMSKVDMCILYQK